MLECEEGGGELPVGAREVVVGEMAGFQRGECGFGVCLYVSGVEVAGCVQALAGGGGFGWWWWWCV